MTPADAWLLLKSAHRAGVPPIHYSTLGALISYTNYRWTCHPGQRALAKLCNVNKDTITASVKWLADRHIIQIHSAHRKVNVYTVNHKSKWKICPVSADSEKSKLSGSTAQFAVRSGRTDENAISRVNCPVPSDVIREPANAGNSSAVADVVFLEASPSVNGHKIAF